MKPVLRTLLLIAALCSLSDSEAQIKADLKTIIDSVIYHARITSLNTRSVNWDSVRADMYMLAQQAKTIHDLQPSFETLLVALKDRKGKFIDPSTNTVIASYPEVQTQPADRSSYSAMNSEFEYQIMEGGIGYLKITGVSPDLQKSASAIRSAIDSLSKEKDLNWIIDLRYSSGGSFSPMIAGMGPLLGEGHVGGVVDGRSKIKKLYEIHNGRFYDDQHLVLSFACAKDMRPSKVAVLLSRNTSGASEIFAITMKGRKNTKFFGEPTAGNITIMNEIKIGNALIMSLSEGLYQDRKGNVYKKNVTPEVPITFQHTADHSQDTAIQAATEWLSDSIIQQSATATISKEEENQ